MLELAETVKEVSFSFACSVYLFEPDLNCFLLACDVCCNK